MDNHHIPHRSSNDGFNHSLFPDNQQQQYRQPNLDSFYQPQPGEQNNYNDTATTGWVYASQPDPSQSRAAPIHSMNWAQNPNATSHFQHQANHATATGQPHPYSRSLLQSPAAFNANPYAAHNNQPAFHYSQQHYDPALFNNPTPDHSFNTVYQPYGNTVGTIAPRALDQAPARHDANTIAQPDIHGANTTRQTDGFLQQPPAENTPQQRGLGLPVLVDAIPKPASVGNVAIVDDSELVTSLAVRPLTAYMHIGRKPVDWPTNRAVQLPDCPDRKSRNELRKLAGNDLKLLAKINKGAAKKLRVPVAKSAGQTASGGVTEMIQYERDAPSSGEESSDYDSDSSDEDEEPPFSDRRPEGLKDGVEYDTIKALWRSRRKPLESASIRKGLSDFWDIVKVIRDRWKADLAAVADAEKKKKIADLAVLKSRVKDQRDMIEVAFKAAQKHGHRDIIELLSGNVSLMFVCYQFLLDRFKAEDLNGSLARVMLEVLSQTTTLTKPVLEKTHLLQVLEKYAKKADAKTAYSAKRIISNATAATEDTLPVQNSDKAKVNGATTTASNRASVTTKPGEAPTAGVKRAAGQILDDAVTKKAATGLNKPNGASPVSKAAVVKKPAATEASKTPATTTVKPKPAAKSSFFASLQSAAKKPGTSIKLGTAIANTAKPGEKKPAVANVAPKSTFSFAETMANLTKPKEEKKEVLPEKQLPAETEKEKAQRLRKEERRKLRVRFKPVNELEEIKYFTHEPEEDTDHDSSQMRDMGDVGGEGRMLRLHKDMMDLDDDEDEDPVLIQFREPVPVDFSAIDAEERQRNYVQRGGLAKVESPEREEREKYESNTLIVFYADSSDIPPNPREPADPYSGDQQDSVVKFGAPDDTFAARARQRKPSPLSAPHQAPLNLEALFKNQQFSAPAPQPQPSMPSTQALSDILAQLSGQAQRPPPAQPPMQAAAPFMGFGAPAPPPQAAPSAVPDIGAILAQLQQSGQLPGPGQQPSAVYDNDRKRMREEEIGDEPATKKRPVPAPSVSPYLYKTKTCMYWRQNRCNKGDNCTFAHEELPE